MGVKLEVTLPKQMNKALENRVKETGQNKSEVTRNALVEELNL